MNRGAVVCTGLVLAVLAGYTAYHVSRATQPESGGGSADTNKDDIIGSRRPDFSLADVSGQQRNINEWDGKVVAINFWATWCPPCIKEIPEFVELQHKYGAAGLQFIGIALQRPEEVTEFMLTYGMNYPVLAGEMEVIRLAESYGNDVGALPYTVIVDRKGNIQLVKRGPLQGEDAEALIVKLL